MPILATIWELYIFFEYSFSCTTSLYNETNIEITALLCQKSVNIELNGKLKILSEGFIW